MFADVLPRRPRSSPMPDPTRIRWPPVHWPWAALRSIPPITRSMRISRSNSANTASICTIIRPAGVEVSNGSVADRNPTPAWSSSSIRTARSRMGRVEPVEAVHQQQVEAGRPRRGQRGAQPGPVRAGA